MTRNTTIKASNSKSFEYRSTLSIMDEGIETYEEALVILEKMAIDFLHEGWTVSFTTFEVC